MIPPPHDSGGKAMIAFLRGHKRAIVAALATAWTVFLHVHPDEWGRFVDLSFFALFVMLIASQFFWVGRILGLVRPVSVCVFIQCGIVLAVLLVFSAFLLIHPGALVDFVDQSFFVCFVMLFGSQYFLIRRVLDVGEWVLPGKPRPAWLAALTCLLCTYVVINSYPWWGSTTSPDTCGRWTRA
jgi:hypothetical protein